MNSRAKVCYLMHTAGKYQWLVVVTVYAVKYTTIDGSDPLTKALYNNTTCAGYSIGPFSVALRHATF